ncbi:MAG: hypothetical protein JWN32_1314, partial [Solirubrobacterales bacterium]|nr:hypothetical protein [Solirubrobacterales bacterium]
RRLAAAGAPGEPKALADPPAADALVIGDDIVVDERAGAFACAHCGERLGGFDTHALEAAVVHELPIAELGERFTDPSVFIDDEVVFRHLYCPGCATRLGGQTARPGDEVLAEFRLTR